MHIQNHSLLPKYQPRWRWLAESAGLSAGLLVTLLLFLGTGGVRAAPPPPTLPHGIAAGDADQTSAILWGRSLATGTVLFDYGASPLEGIHTITRTVSDPAVPVTVALTGLMPGTSYVYSLLAPDGSRVDGHFRTAEAAGTRSGLRFGVSGDWRGELAPYPVLRNAPDRALDFFVGLGDTIYADVPSPAVPDGHATTLAELRLKHSEVYSTHFGLNVWADLRRVAPLYMMIDDHEVVNDFAGGAGAETDPRFPETEGLINDTARFENGLRAFHEYNPLRAERYGSVGGDGRMDHERKLYRYRTFGSDAALILLDSRSFRDTELATLDYSDPRDILRFLEESFAPNRTMLGSQQLSDLKADLLDAERRGILWKFVAVPEPIQNLGVGNAEDRFEGYAAERTELLRFIQAQGIRNVVFIAADIHGTIVNNLTYQEGVGEPQIPTGAFEVTTGSLAYDAPFGPTVIEYAVDLGIISPTLEALYHSLPVAPDADAQLDDKDDFIEFVLDQQLRVLGYDTVGLDGAPGLSAQLLQGAYLAVHTYGWTEFDIAPGTGLLTVTTYAIPAYTAAEMAADAAGITTRPITVASQFTIQPDTSQTIYIPLIHSN